MGGKVFRIGTRGSKLALWQANHVAQCMREADESLAIEVVVVHTKGDKILDVALSKIGDKGLFTKDLERALKCGEVDCCVHSMKDVPTVLDEGLELASMLSRADARDVLVAAPGTTLESLRAGARVGTGSLRRRAQLMALYPQLEYVELRGNLDTRMGKVADGTLDAAVLAAAGIVRMGWEERIAQRLDVDEVIPAVGQGAIGVEVRSDDAFAKGLCAAIACGQTMACVEAEREVMRALEGGCQVPIAAHATIAKATMSMNALVASLDGARIVRAAGQAPAEQGRALAGRIVCELRAQGAEAILEEVRARAQEVLPSARIVR